VGRARVHARLLARYRAALRVAEALRRARFANCPICSGDADPPADCRRSCQFAAYLRLPVKASPRP